jgi:hypothetical protein
MLSTTLPSTPPPPAPSAATFPPTRVRLKAFSPSSSSPESPRGTSPSTYTSIWSTLLPTISVTNARTSHRSNALVRSLTPPTSSSFNSSVSTLWAEKTNIQSRSPPPSISTHTGRPATREIPLTNSPPSSRTPEALAPATTAALQRGPTNAGTSSMTQESPW